MKNSEGINQRTFMLNPWTWTTMWGLVWGGVWVGLGEGEEGGKVGKTVTA